MIRRSLDALQRTRSRLRYLNLLIVLAYIIGSGNVGQHLSRLPAGNGLAPLSPVDTFETCSPILRMSRGEPEAVVVRSNRRE